MGRVIKKIGKKGRRVSGGGNWVKKMPGMGRVTKKFDRYPVSLFSGRNPARNLAVCRATEGRISTFRRYYVNIDYLNRAKLELGATRGA